MEPPTYQRPGYDTDLSDAEWELLKPLIYLPEAKRGRGARRDPNSTRACLDAIRYVLKTGCQWSLLPKEFAPKSTVHDALSTWTRQGLWERLNAALRPKARRKRHALTDTNGLLLGVVVTPASVQDRDGAKLLLCMFCHSFMGLLMIFADGVYAGKLEQFVQRMGQLFGHGASFGLGIIKKLADQQGFIVLPRRWVIERSFGWLVKQRRLTRDHEKNPRHHEAFVYLAFIGVMTRRLTTSAVPSRRNQAKAHAARLAAQTPNPHTLVNMVIHRIDS
jgi:transposase